MKCSVNSLNSAVSFRERIKDDLTPTPFYPFTRASFERLQPDGKHIPSRSLIEGYPNRETFIHASDISTCWKGGKAWIIKPVK